MTSVAFIVPCFNEEDNIFSFYNQFSECFSHTPPLNYEWQLIFIDDGSTDSTWCRLTDLALQNPRVTAIRFSRNFGKESAIWAGLNNATADYIGIIDADLQQDPADALAMCEILEKNPDIDCVAAYQKQRYEKGIVAHIKRSFYSFFAKISELDAVENASDFRVFRKYVANAILSMPESFRFSKGIFAWVGFNVYAYPYQPADRTYGNSKWSFFGLIKYAIEGVLSFSVKPLRLATGLGLFAASCAIIYFIVVFIRALAIGIEVPGYATLMSTILLLGGMQLICIGIMGEYLARTYLQGKQRPIYIEKSRIASEDIRASTD